MPTTSTSHGKHGRTRQPTRRRLHACAGRAAQAAARPRLPAEAGDAAQALRVGALGRWTSSASTWPSTPACCSRQVVKTGAWDTAAIGRRRRTTSSVRLPAGRAAVRQGGRCTPTAPPAARLDEHRHGAVPGHAGRVRLRADQQPPRAVLELLHLLRDVLLRGHLRRLHAAGLPEGHGRLLRPRATGGGRCSSAAAGTSRPSRHALRDETNLPIEMLGFISLTPRPNNGLRSLGRSTSWRRVLDDAPRPGGHHRRPGLPGGAAPSSSSTMCHQRGVHVRIAPSTMEHPHAAARSSSRARRCRCSSCARRSSRASTTSLKRDVRLRRRVCCC